MDVDVPDTPDYFLVTFGLPRRDMLADRSKTPTLSQALHMMNGDTIVQKSGGAGQRAWHSFISGGGRTRRIISELYQRALRRRPLRARSGRKR